MFVVIVAFCFENCSVVISGPRNCVGVDWNTGFQCSTKKLNLVKCYGREVEVVTIPCSIFLLLIIIKISICMVCVSLLHTHPHSPTHTCVSWFCRHCRTILDENKNKFPNNNKNDSPCVFVCVRVSVFIHYFQLEKQHPLPPFKNVMVVS